jgi:hypothetical protein
MKFKNFSAMKIRYSLLVLLLLISISGFSKTKKFGTWMEFEFNKKIIKHLDFSFIPEVRFNDNFAFDEYILEGKLNYELFKYLEFAGSYRYNSEIKDKGNKISHSAVLDITGKTGFDRFDASIRTRFTNDASGDELRTFYFRPRAKLSYNIKGSKLEPYTSYELFMNLKQSDFYKQRFDFGVQRKIGEYHRVGVYYRLQDYFYDKSSISILGIDYRFKF